MLTFLSHYFSKSSMHHGEEEGRPHFTDKEVK